MKKIVSIAVAAALLLMGCAAPAEPSRTPEPSVQATPAAAQTPAPTQQDNMVKNGDFSAGLENWSLFLDKGGSAELTDGGGEAAIKIVSCGSEDYSVQLYYDGFKLETGGVYRFAFEARSDIERQASARLQLNGGSYTGYAEGTFDLSKEMQTFEIKFAMTQGTDRAPRLCFNIGTPKGLDVLPGNTVYIDNVEITLLDGSNILAPEPETDRPDINISQIGYEPGEHKIAVLRGDKLGDTFEVVAADGTVTLEGDLTGPISSEPSGETNYTTDFSALTKEGTYTIRSGDAESYPFEIREGIYADAFKSVFRMLYLQRCGTQLPASLAGDFAHPECHTGEAILYGTNKKKDVSGGWHDAGDYGRYVVSGAKAAADLLFAYQDFSEALQGDDYGIPESGNGVPDVLDEVRYELDWMLKMQDGSGGVYHKVTGLAFPGEVMPEMETEPLYIMPVSNTATGDFAAVMAMSYAVFKEMDSRFAKTCLDAAKKAWEYLEEHPEGRFENPEDVLTGEYYDGSDTDERYWAAAALYSATGEEEYLDEFERIVGLFVYVMDGYGWKDVGGYANSIYLSLDAAVTDPACLQRIRDAIKQKADGYLKNSESDAYGVSLGLTYPWGSNMTVCDNAGYLNLAEELFGNAEYSAAADRHFDYIFGANPMSICYVTGMGSVSPLHPHHRPSMAAGETMPGMLAGGPNKNLEDPYAKAVLADAPPAKCYADNAQSFSTNEVAVYWNSALIALMAQRMCG